MPRALFASRLTSVPRRQSCNFQRVGERLAARQGSPGMLIAFPSALTPRMSANLGLFRTRTPGARPSRHCGVPTLVKGLPFTAGRALHCRLSHTLNVTGLTTGYIRQAWRALGGRAFDQRSACRRSREGAYPALAVSAADMELDAWFRKKSAAGKPGSRPRPLQYLQVLQLFDSRVLDLGPLGVRVLDPLHGILLVLGEDGVIDENVELAVDDIGELRIAVELPAKGHGIGAESAELGQVAGRICRERVRRSFRSKVVGHAIVGLGECGVAFGHGVEAAQRHRIEAVQAERGAGGRNAGRRVVFVGGEGRLMHQQRGQRNEQCDLETVHDVGFLFGCVGSGSAISAVQRYAALIALTASAVGAMSFAIMRKLVRAAA